MPTDIPTEANQVFQYARRIVEAYARGELSDQGLHEALQVCSDVWRDAQDEKHALRLQISNMEKAYAKACCSPQSLQDGAGPLTVHQAALSTAAFGGSHS